MPYWLYACQGIFYGCDVHQAFLPLAGGFQARVWTDGSMVLKVFDDGLPPSLDVLARLDLPVAPPTATATIGGFGVALFPFVRGRPARESDELSLARAMRRMHDHPLIDLPRLPIEEAWIDANRGLVDHPWLRDRRAEVVEQLERLDDVIERARHTPRPDVVCHTDFGAHNVLIDDPTGEVVAILDWDFARLAPREHDLWAAFDEPDPRAYLDAYGRDVELDRAHLEYALLARGVRDAFARVASETDRLGVDTWGFARWRRVDSDLALAGL